MTDVQMPLSSRSVIVEKIAEGFGRDPRLAGKLFDETLRFLIACGNNPDKALTPSEEIDECWHTFLLYTRIYAEFCHANIGQFIHHNPRSQQHLGGVSPVDTYFLMRDQGLEPDEDYWLNTTSADCDGGRGCDGLSPEGDNTLAFALA